ncbi:hypothetical protein HMPREF1548_06954 [Clostridium sp. KLE 1755]|nr:hypothetical protein HMPREF1548_06954 [Clostridium sp. KLE 1755]
MCPETGRNPRKLWRIRQFFATDFSGGKITAENQTGPPFSA